MLIFRGFFKAQSDQNTHQNALNCTKYSRELAYAPEPSTIYVQLCISKVST